MNSNITLEFLDFRFTPLRLNPSYVYYYTHWTRLLCTGIIPFFYLLFTNVCIFITIKRSSKVSQKLQWRGTKRRKLGRKRKIPKKSSMTLAAIVILYLSCNTPRLLLNCVEYHYFSFIMDGDFCECNKITYWFDFLLSISRLCLVINSSANILIYFSISTMFKKQLISKIRLTRANL